MIITNSMVKSYQDCKKAYTFKYPQQLLRKTGARSLPLKRGVWLHKLLETMYLGGDWREVHKELSKDYDRLFDEEKDLYGDLPTHCFRIMRAYDHYWKLADKDLRIIEVEKTFIVPLPHGHSFKFTLDGLVEDEYGFWLFEHKSHLSIPTSDYRFMDPQTARYFWALEQLGYPMVGVLWNYLSTLNLSKPKLTQKGALSRSKIRSDPYTFSEGLKDLGLDPREYKDDIISVKRRLPTLYRRERVPKPAKVSETLVKDMVHIADEIERGYRPLRHITRTCERCEYMMLCLTQLYGGDAQQVRKSQYRKAISGDHSYSNEELRSL